MRLLFIFLLVIKITNVQGQFDTTNKCLRAFPITDYMVALNDSTTVVQIELPDDIKISDLQIGVLYGRFKSLASDAVEKGAGKCHLIKKPFYYFAIKGAKGKQPEKGDLIYTYIDRSPIYNGRFPKLAAHFIRLQNVYGDNLYDRFEVFRSWKLTDEKNLMDSLKADIQFTGRYFLENDPSIDKPIGSGIYSGQKTLYVMAECQILDLERFLDYVLARPRNYAGAEWKISEIFATWLSEGAPIVQKGG
jgi:hypothetical protein